MSTRLASPALEVSGELKLESRSSSGASSGASPPRTPNAPRGFQVGMCTECEGEWKLAVREASLLGHFSMCVLKIRDSAQALEAEAEVTYC